MGSVKQDLLVLVLRNVFLLDFTALLDHHGIEFEFHCLTLHHFLFDGVPGDQAIYEDFFLLTDSVGPVHCLDVYLGVEI